MAQPEVSDKHAQRVARCHKEVIRSYITVHKLDRVQMPQASCALEQNLEHERLIQRLQHKQQAKRMIEDLVQGENMQGLLLK
jgi:hypothetical protein